jgi:hypothetical protein
LDSQGSKSESGAVDKLEKVGKIRSTFREFPSGI